ncbi:MAG: transcriptional regulator NrdR [Alphaproteobacteria bacterium]
MKCPFCTHEDTQVKDSRPTEDGVAIRRRRQCSQCAARFTTFERFQLRELMIVKKDGTQEPFDRDKIQRSMQIALRKRKVESGQVERIINSMVRQLESSGETEIKVSVVGEMVMEALKQLDKVAYVRFASVYRDFNEVEDFAEFLEQDKKPA